MSSLFDLLTLWHTVPEAFAPNAETAHHGAGDPHGPGDPFGLGTHPGHAPAALLDNTPLGFADPQIHADLFTPPPLSWNPANFDGAGTPVSDAADWHYQHGQTDCAVVAQASIYESLTGHPLPETEACRIAQENGLFDPAVGTRPKDFGKLLNVLGIPTETRWGAQITDLADALDRGDKVLVSANANEIWNPVHDSATGQPVTQTPGGHAVWVTGIEQGADGSYRVILNDSGSLDGRGEVVDLMDFQHAWQEFGGQMIVAHPAAPGTALGSHDWTSVANSGFLYERVNGEYTGNYTKA